MDSYQKGNYVTALKEFITILEIDKNNTSLYLQSSPYIMNLISDEKINANKELMEWLVKESSNNSNALNILGLMYINGFGFKKDRDKALQLFKLSCDQNNPYAQINLARSLYTTKEISEAIKLFELNVERGFEWGFCYLFSYYYSEDSGDNKDIDKAMKLLKIGAEKNNDTCQLYLALMYQQGINIEQNSTEAIKLFELSANQGNYISKLFWICLTNGQPQTINTNFSFYDFETDEMKKLIFDLLKDLAEKSYDLAQCVRSMIFELEKNEDEKLKWLKLSAENGLGFAQNILGMRCLQDENYKEAHKWFTLAVENGIYDAYHNLACVYLNGLGVEKDLDKAFDLSKANIEKNKKNDTLYLLSSIHAERREYEEALKLLSDESLKHDKHAQFCIGKIYYEFMIDKKKAFEYLKLSADQNYPHACFLLAMMYKSGEHVEINLKECIRLHQIAIDAGITVAMDHLGCIYLDEKDYDKAFALFKRSADNKNKIGQFNLSTMYRYERGVAKNMKESVRLLELSAEQGLLQAQRDLADIYKKGEGDIEKDYHKAVHWYKKAVDQGSNELQSEITKVFKLMVQDEIYLTNLSMRYFEYDRLLMENEELRYKPPEVGGPGYYLAKETYESATQKV